MKKVWRLGGYNNIEKRPLFLHRSAKILFNFESFNFLFSNKAIVFQTVRSARSCVLEMSENNTIRKMEYRL